MQMSCGAAGKHIILEKPMALTLCRLRRHHRRGRARQRPSDRRPHPRVSIRRCGRCARIVASGELGRTRHDRRLELHQFPLPAAAAGRTRYRARRRHPVQPGAAPDRHGSHHRRRAAAQRPRPGDTRSTRRGRPKAAPRVSWNSRTARRPRWSMAAMISSTATNCISGFQSAARTSPPISMARRAARLAARKADEERLRVERYAYGAPKGRRRRTSRISASLW